MRPLILIVDDSVTVRMDLAEAFNAAGFSSALCGTIAAARAAVAKGAVSLIILDVLLPDADGIGFLHGIKSAPATSAIPVLLLSSEAEVEDRVRGMKTGADDYVGKPYDTGYIVARARELLRAKGQEASRQGAGTILVIDDSLTFREQLKEALEGSGYQVLAAANGEEGLRAAAGCRPAAVIVDSVMPGIDGATVIRRMRLDAVLRGTPCLLLTASEDRAEELRALEAGADGFVRKGEDMPLLLARLSAVLRGAAGTVGDDITAALRAPKRILAVDDSATYLQELADHLRQEGYDVVTASSGEKALELLAVQPVDCVLLDLLMPGLSGQETCRRIRGSPQWRDLPLIMLTAMEERDAMIEGINLGADDYITKTSEFDVLRARLQALLRRKQFEDENRQIRERLMRKELETAEAQAARRMAEARAALMTDLEKKNRDLSAAKSALEAANQELEAFSSSVSHDLRAPLRHVEGYIELLQNKLKGLADEECARYLKTISASAMRMGALIDDVLAFSRLGKTDLHKTKADLNPLVREVRQELETRGRDVQWKIAALPQVDCDLSMLRLVFVNLLSNALKFTRAREHAVIEIGALPDRAGEVVVFVRDNGAGFDMRYAQKLFGVFQRLHSQEEFAGTGVGLANIRRIISRHGGRTWAEGAVGKGATFYFSLPMSPSEVGL